MFEPTAPPDDPKLFGQWAMTNFTTLVRLMNDGCPGLTFAPLGIAPLRPKLGALANANGTTWNPTGTAGVHEWNGTAWVKV